MALVPWAQINNMYDLQVYLEAGRAEAQTKCTAAYPQYAAAYNYLVGMMALPAASQPSNLVAEVKTQVESARAIWRANCSVDAQSAPLVEESADPQAVAAAGGNGIGKWLLLGAVGVGLYFLLRKKKPNAPKTNPCKRRRRR